MPPLPGFNRRTTPIESTAVVVAPLQQSHNANSTDDESTKDTTDPLVSELLQDIPEDDQNFDEIIRNYKLSPRVAQLMQSYSKYSNDTLVAIRAGGTPPLTDSSEKPLDIKAKTTNVKFLTGMILKERSLYKTEKDGTLKDTDTHIRALLDEIPQDKYPFIPVTKTPLEILRALHETSLEIASTTQNDDGTYTLTLKYAKDCEPKAFGEKDGKFIITLEKPETLTDNREPIYEDYRNAEGKKILDPQKVTDKEIEDKIPNILPNNIPPAIRQYFTDHIHKELKVYTRFGNNEPEILECASKNKKPISGDIDIANISVPLNLQLPKKLDQYLYKAINVLDKDPEKRLSNKRDLLRNTEELFKYFQLDYYKKMKLLEQNIALKTKQQKRYPHNKLLKQELASLHLEKRILEESSIHKILQAQGYDYNAQKSQETTLFKRLFNPAPKIVELATIICSTKNIEEFSSLAGNITPFEFLHNIINNELDIGHHPFQHGSDNRTPGEPEADKPQIHFFRGHIFVTQDDAQRVKLYSNEQYFNNHYEYVNPRSNMKTWGPLVQKQLESPKHKHLVASDTKQAYFKYLFENTYNNNLTGLITYITNNHSLENSQKKEALKIIRQHEHHKENASTENIKEISDAINQLSRMGSLTSRLTSVSMPAIWRRSQTTENAPLDTLNDLLEIPRNPHSPDSSPRARIYKDRTLLPATTAEATPITDEATQTVISNENRQRRTGP